MSIYSNNQVITHILDPVFSRSNQRVEFRLPNDVKLLSNMRVGGLGAFASVASTYNGMVGGLGVIQSIHLLDGENAVLDQLLQAPIYNAFKNYNHTNQEQKDRLPNLSKNTMAMSFNGVEAGAAGNAGAKISLYDLNASARQIQTSEAATATTWFSVADMLPLLRQMLVVDTSVLRNLKLVIEISTDIDSYAIETANAPFSTTQPFLIFDQMVGDGPAFQNVEYTSIEHDRISVPADVATVAQVSKIQNQNSRVGGFNNKSVVRMLIAKNPQLLSTYQTTGTNMRYSNLGSVSCFKEELQVRVNGQNMFAGSGLGPSDNERLAMCNDVWGTMSTYNYANGSAYLADGVNRNVHIDVGNDIMSSLDYYGVLINSEISDLQLNFSRTIVNVQDSGPADISDTASVNQALDLNIFCEVKKAIISDGSGGYLIQYV